MAVGARNVLVAYNVWLADPDLALARRLATMVPSPSVRALGLRVGDHVQVSMNLIDALTTGPGAVADLVAKHAPVQRCELVGLVPRWVLDREDPQRWGELDLGPDRTIEGRLDAGGFRR
jgi:glutamate formiminotransferase